MNFEQLRKNLEQTIVGKEELLRTKYDIRHTNFLNAENEAAFTATREYLVLNIGELKRILVDVNKCEPRQML